MQLKHNFTVPATKDETWAAFDNIESVAECFPGALVTSVEGDTFEGTVKVKLGPIALVYKGTGTFTEKDESAGTMVIAAKGKDKRGNGTAGADVVATMKGNGDSTDIEVVTDLNITGKPAQFGRGVIQDVSDKLLGQFVACLENKVGSGPAPSQQATAAPAAAAPADGGSGNGVAPAAASAPASGAGGPSAVPSPAAANAPAGGGSSGPSAVPSSTGQQTAPKPAASSGGAQEEPEALDLGATVLPILAKAYWKQALAGVVGVAVVVWVVTKLV